MHKIGVTFSKQDLVQVWLYFLLFIDITIWCKVINLSLTLLCSITLHIFFPPTWDAFSFSSISVFPTLSLSKKKKILNSSPSKSCLICSTWQGSFVCASSLFAFYLILHYCRNLNIFKLTNVPLNPKGTFCYNAFCCQVLAQSEDCSEPIFPHGCAMWWCDVFFFPQGYVLNIRGHHLLFVSLLCGGKFSMEHSLRKVS